MATIGALQTSVGECATTVHASCTALSKQVEQKLSNVEKRQRSMEQKMQALQEKVGRLEAILGIMQNEVPPTPTEDNTSFDHKVDPCALICRSKNIIRRDELVKSVVGPILEKNNMQLSEIVIESDPAAKRFVVRVSGSAPYASRKINQILSSFKIAVAQWERFCANDVNGTRAQVHISTDKSPSQVQRDILTKKIKTTLVNLYPDHHYHINKHLGEVSTQWKPLVRVTPRAGVGSKPIFEFAEANLAFFGIDRETVSEKLENLTPTPALFHHKIRVRTKKFRYLKKLLGKGMILGLQETHGTLAELRDFFFHLHMPVEAFASFLEHGENAAGG
ncbi:unnamed protein product, partial [Prorocentrum cordatum]